MTVLEFLSDRLGRLVLWGSCTVLAAGILHAYRDFPGVLILLLAALFLVFWRPRPRLSADAPDHRDLGKAAGGIGPEISLPRVCPKPQRLYERKLLDITRRSGQAMIGAVSEAQAAQRDYREYVERWVHEIKTPITAARLMARRSGADTGESWRRNWTRSEPMWNGRSFTPGRRIRRRTFSFTRPVCRTW
ncbi:MAG: hypothetical protein ACLS43_11315 [Evtepia gabavorous]